MKLTATPAEFQTHSVRLLRAYPSSTKVTTTYHSSATGKGALTLKTYDPVSGVVIKFSTTKIADVGRLVAGLQRLAREQIGVLEEEREDVVMAEANEKEVATPAAAAAPATPAPATPAPAPTPADGGAAKGKGKKKKGKK
ncbi:signal recognition particle 9 kDa protein-domain-containing protein [Tricharina praecox]|uniref:signal recognition particle 9 kDa protein-domain-containing protein n=1 Tax=Tricharina praecox TaxID=43433 RepID=UPI00221FC215|nr:signal recognition particle 9 kDa protein-domain-containing protein [Tricharina praecox]KAI5850893.1 signal recognition particle 9 kDa protein-domain-containing protein [Tricharina praecox]